MSKQWSTQRKCWVSLHSSFDLLLCKLFQGLRGDSCGTRPSDCCRYILPVGSTRDWLQKVPKSEHEAMVTKVKVHQWGKKLPCKKIVVQVKMSMHVCLRNNDSERVKNLLLKAMVLRWNEPEGLIAVLEYSTTPDVGMAWKYSSYHIKSTQMHLKSWL